MRTTIVIAHFGGIRETAAALGVTRQAVEAWGKNVPEKIAYKMQVLTAGILIVNPSIYKAK